MEERHYHPSELPIFETPINSEDQFNISKELYSQVHSNYRHLVDVRFKLLGFVPAISIIAWVQLLYNLNPSDISNAFIGIVIGLLALRVTYGIRTYDKRNDELYEDLINRGCKIEDEWNIHTGIFKGRIRGLERDSFKNNINHHRGTSLVYSTVFLGWILLVMWYILHIIVHFGS